MTKLTMAISKVVQLLSYHAFAQDKFSKKKKV